MAQISNLICNGVARILSKLYVNDSVTAPTFIGKLQGNADSATKVNGHTVNADVPSGAKFTDTNTTYSAGRGISLSGTTFKVADTCTTISDWNSATTSGYYMASSASNAPVSGWLYGEVIAHNTNYVRQIVYRFAVNNEVANGNCDKYERVKHNGTWGSWVNTSVRVAVPSDAKFTDTNTWRGVQNNLTSTSTSDSLSAYQGKVLNDSKANIHSWNAIVKGVTWSRLCYVGCAASVVGSSFLLNVAGTRGSVVYNDTYVIKAHHNQRATISKISGCNYSSGLKLRVLADSNGNCYVELYDNANSITNSTTQTVYCRLLSIYTGSVTKYTAFTDGSTLPSNFVSSATITTNTNSLQGNLTWDEITGKPSTYAPSSHTHSYLPLSGGTLTGQVTQSVSGNPYYGLNDGTNLWYFQAYQNKAGMGTKWTTATQWDTSGNMVVNGSITGSSYKLGNATFAYDSTNKRVVISVS